MNIFHNLANRLSLHATPSPAAVGTTSAPMDGSASAPAKLNPTAGEVQEDLLEPFRRLAPKLNGCDSAVIVRIEGREFGPLSPPQKKEVDRLFQERGYFRVAGDSDPVVPFFPHCQIYPMRPDSPCPNSGMMHAVAVAEREEDERRRV